MTLYLCYNDKSVEFKRNVSTLIYEFYPLINVEAFDENDFKQRKKAFKLKGGYSARMTPFMLLTDDENKVIQAFYSESQDCTLEKLDSVLQNIIFYGDDKITGKPKNEFNYESASNKQEQ